MIPGQSSKMECVVIPIEYSAAGTSNVTVDTLGWDHMDLYVTQGANAATHKMGAAMSLTDGTDTTAAGAIIPFLGTTNTVTTSASGFTIPAGHSTGAQTVKFDVDCTKYDRYIRLNYTAHSVTAPIAAFAILSRGRVEPGSDDGSVSVTATG